MPGRAAPLRGVRVSAGWLHVRAEPADAAALGALRAVTALVMQNAARDHEPAAQRVWRSCATASEHVFPLARSPVSFLPSSAH